MTWKIVIVLQGEEPEDEQELVDVEGTIEHALDNAGVGYEYLEVLR